MTNQEKKKYLSQAYWLDKHINSLISERDSIQELKSKCLKCTVSYENDGSQSGSHSNSTESAFVNYIDKLNEYEAELSKNIDELVDVKHKIKQIIMLVPKYEQREILIKRYLNYDKWEQIAVDMDYTIRRIYQLHGEGLQNIPDKTFH